jgi:hypothetical protein
MDGEKSEERLLNIPQGIWSTTSGKIRGCAQVKWDTDQ